jgi:hypothetical protein
MRDILSKLNAIVSETALQDKEDLKAKRQALDDLESDPVASQDPVISAAIDQRRADLDQEAKSKGLDEDEDLYQIGDDFGISFSEEFEISAAISDILEDGIVIDLDETAITYLSQNGFTFEDIQLDEEKQKGVDGKACWKGYKRMGTKQKGGKTVDNCVKSEDLDEYFQFEFPKGKDRGPRDHGHDELARREKTMGKGGLAKDARDYKEKDKYGDAYKIKGPKGKLPEDTVAEGYPSDNDMGTIAGTNKKMTLGQWKQMWQKKMPNADMSLFRFPPNMQGSAIAYFDGWMNNPDARWDPEKGVAEAEYQGRKVPLGKPMKGDVKKSKVYVKNPQGNVVKVNFGDKKMRIKKSNPNRRKSFRARHNCANPGPRHKARYWSCRAW